MGTKFEREERYLVFKLADVEKDFFPSEISQLLRLYETQQNRRKQRGKPPLECVVVEAGAQLASSVPVKAIGKMLADVMAVAVSNGANSVSMPDEYVEVAVWLQGECPTQPAPSVPDGWKLVPIEPTEDMLRAMTDPFVAINGDNRKAFESAYKAMLAAAPNERSEYPEAKP